MNDSTKQAYLDKMAGQLNEWKAKVDLVNAKVSQFTAGVRIEYNTKLENWQKREPIFKSKVDELRTATVEGYENVKTSVQTMWMEINALIESMEGNKNEIKK